MRSILVKGDVPDELVANAVRATTGEIQQQVRYLFGTTRITLFVAQKYFFRTNDRLGLIVLAVSNGSSERIDMTYSGGGSGLLNVQWGAGDELEESFHAALVQALRSAGFRSEPSSPDGGTAPPPASSRPLP
jgi:hypothetical protein